MRNQSMGVGKSMKIFMEGMQNSMMSSGYTGKIVNTPMGPFSWNDTTNSWVNQNNGFSIPNISLQELMMYDYVSVGDETRSSGNGFSPILCNYTIDALDNRNAGVITGRVSFGNVSIRDNTCPIDLSLRSTSAGRNAFKLYISTDLGATFTQFTQFSVSVTRTAPITISVTQFRIYVEANFPIIGGETILFDLINDSDNNTVVATYAAELPPEF